MIKSLPLFLRKRSVAFTPPPPPPAIPLPNHTAVSKLGLSQYAMGTLTNCKGFSCTIIPSSLAPYSNVSVRVMLIRLSFNATHDMMLVSEQTLINGALYGNPQNIEWYNILIPINTVGWNMPSFDNFVRGGDDNAPVNISGVNNGGIYFSGGGHGLEIPKLVVSGHGKTSADITSEWQDTTGQRWYLMGINGDNLYFVPKNSTNPNEVEVNANPMPPTGALTHISGAVNTSNINYSTLLNWQFWGFFKHDTRLFINGVEVDILTNQLITSGIQDIKLCTTVKHLNPQKAIEAAIANKPVGGYTGLFTEYAHLNSYYQYMANAEYYMQEDIVYDFQDFGIAVYANLKTLKDLRYVLYSAVQTQFQITNCINTVSRYIPNLLPQNDGAGSIDFRIGSGNMIDKNAGYPYLNNANVYNGLKYVGLADREDTSKVLARSFDLKNVTCNGQTFDIIVQTGWLPTRSMVSRAYDYDRLLIDTAKTYQFPVSEFTGSVTTPATVTPSEWSLVSYVSVTPKDINKTNASKIKADGVEYVFEDYHSAGNYTINIPVGKTLQIISKSANVNISGNIVTVSASTPMYAYLEGKFV